MKTTVKIIFLLIIISAASVLSMSDKKTPAPVVTAQPFDTTAGPPHTTTRPSHTTTGASNTTTRPSHTTTGASNTTTGPSHTTTGTSNTTGASNTTTGSPHTTTSTPAPPAPQPTPHASWIPGNYNVTDGRSEVCLRAYVALRIRLSREKSSGVFILQPQLTRAVGGCEGSSANLTLGFSEGHVTFLFIKNATEDKVYVHALSFVLFYPLEGKGSSSSYSASIQSVRLFPAKTGHSYGCNMESVSLGSGLYLDLSQDQLQAFNLTKSHDFGPADACASDHHDYGVAIGVGVALLVLIVIAVLVYFLVRRRRTGGYQLL